MSDSNPDSHLEPIARLTRDLRTAAQTLSDNEARYLVDAYYIIQEDRKRSRAQERALSPDEPHTVISWLADQSATLESQIQQALDAYTSAHLMGSWMRGVFGIGPVLSAGLLAHIDITKAPTAGHIWQFAGIAGDNQRPWKKGQKRPFNAKLKVLCWKIGQSFMKQSGSPKCYYGHIYHQRKEYEAQRNAQGLYAETAKRILETRNIGKDTEAFKHYSEGRLPPGHIDARARRYAVKLFLSHLHGEWYKLHFKTDPPNPYPIAILGHAHYIPPPKA